MPSYGQITKYAKVPDNTPPLYAKRTKDIQAKVGSLLYYLQTVDPSVLTHLNKISGSQAKPTLYTNIATDMLLSYAHKYTNAKIHNRAGPVLTRTLTRPV